MIFEHVGDDGRRGILGIDADARLYWNGEPVVMRQEIRFNWWVNLAVVVGDFQRSSSRCSRCCCITSLQGDLAVPRRTSPFTGPALLGVFFGTARRRLKMTTWGKADDTPAREGAEEHPRRDVLALPQPAHGQDGQLCRLRSGDGPRTAAAVHRGRCDFVG